MARPHEDRQGGLPEPDLSPLVPEPDEEARLEGARRALRLLEAAGMVEATAAAMPGLTVVAAFAELHQAPADCPPEGSWVRSPRHGMWHRVGRWNARRAQLELRCAQGGLRGITGFVRTGSALRSAERPAQGACRRCLTYWPELG